MFQEEGTASAKVLRWECPRWACVAGEEEAAQEGRGCGMWAALVGLGQALAFAPSEMGALAGFGAKE